METLYPATVEELGEAVAAVAAHGRKLTIRGGGSKAAIGAPTPDAAILSLRAFTGIVDYDPAELVLTAGAATPLAEVQGLLAASGQMLAFDPFDHGPLFGAAAGAATLGGVLAAGVAGSQRLSQGGARDHLLGFTAVSGRGERFLAGARVVKNVTGYDLPKLAANSWGRLFAMTEVTVKVMPAPRLSATRIVEGLDFATAQAVMAAAMGSTADVAAAAHRPADGDAPSRTALRLQGFGPSVAARLLLLDRVIGTVTRQPPRAAEAGEAEALWTALRTLAPLAGDTPLWRINVPPSAGPALVDALDGRWLADWAGGLIWLASDADPLAIRAAAAQAGGHAMLIRAPMAMRAAVPALHPPEPGVALLEERIARAFDPAGVFATGRMTGDRA